MFQTLSGRMKKNITKFYPGKTPQLHPHTPLSFHSTLFIWFS